MKGARLGQKRIHWQPQVQGRVARLVGDEPDPGPHDHRPTKSRSSISLSEMKKAGKVVKDFYAMRSLCAASSAVQLLPMAFVSSCD
jgi:hypothetical protein